MVSGIMDGKIESRFTAPQMSLLMSAPLAAEMLESRPGNRYLQRMSYFLENSARILSDLASRRWFPRGLKRAEEGSLVALWAIGEIARKESNA